MLHLSAGANEEDVSTSAGTGSRSVERAVRVRPGRRHGGWASGADTGSRVVLAGHDVDRHGCGQAGHDCIGLAHVRRELHVDALAEPAGRGAAGAGARVACSPPPVEMRPPRTIARTMQPRGWEGSRGAVSIATIDRRGNGRNARTPRDACSGGLPVRRTGTRRAGRAGRVLLRPNVKAAHEGNNRSSSRSRMSALVIAAAAAEFGCSERREAAVLDAEFAVSSSRPSARPRFLPPPTARRRTISAGCALRDGRRAASTCRELVGWTAPVSGTGPTGPPRRRRRGVDAFAPRRGGWASSSRVTSEDVGLQLVLVAVPTMTLRRSTARSRSVATRPAGPLGGGRDKRTGLSSCRRVK